MSMKPQVKCPAGEEQNPVTDPNPLSIECRIQGNLRPARRFDGKLQPCCTDYANCPVWKTHKKVERENRTVRVAEQSRRNRSGHTIDAPREKVTA